MKDTIGEIFAKFGNSKAVFKSKLEGDSIKFDLIEQYDPATADLDHNDIIVKLAVANYRENFDKYELYRSANNKTAVMRDIFVSLKKAFESASPLKNPKQSNLWKWFDYDSITKTQERTEAIILLYRYVHANTDRNLVFSGGSSNPHAKNFLAILEKMKEKYERR